MKKLVFVSVLSFLACLLSAQPVVTIQKIQQATAANLANCIDTSGYVLDTVIVRGVVITDAKVGTANNAQAANGRNTWIQAGTGPWSGIDVYKVTSSSTATTPDDLLNLIAGDSVEIKGVVLNYLSAANPNAAPIGESEINPLTVKVIGSGVATPTVVDLSDINDVNQVNNLATGEQWEGVYIELQDVTVTAVVYFSSNTRVSFNVVDAAGNKINVSDRFLAQRLPALGGTYVPPVVGDKFDHLRGVLAHSVNGCTGTGRGYELYPTKPSDYKVTAGFSAPQISNITRSIVTPTDAQSATVSANIIDVDGTVASAGLFYAVGVNTATYTLVAMTAVGTTYSAAIPAQADGSFIKYYVSATDNGGLTASQPAVPAGITNALFFTVRNGGTTIYDVQYTPYANGNSGYINTDVTISGIITASVNDLGYVMVQQEGGLLGWAGLSLTGNASLATLATGDKITATGTVKESFGMTRLESISAISKTGTGTIQSVTAPVDSFSSYKYSRNEQYEGMLVTFNNPGKKLYVVAKNAETGANQGEYRVGKDVFSPKAGCRVLAGRQTSTTFSSLNVPYVNDSLYMTADGIMNVPPCVVNYQDSMESVTGIIYYSFSNMKLLPRNAADFVKFSGVNCPLTSVDNTLLEGVSVYPNPAADMLHIRMEANTPAIAVLRDMTGREVARTTAQGETVLSTVNVANGTYVLSITSRGAVSNHKVVIVK